MKYAKDMDGQILYDGIKLELYVPNDYFKSGLAEEVGSSYLLFGNLRALHYDNKSDDRSSARYSTCSSDNP